MSILDAVTRWPWRRSAATGWVGVYRASEQRLVAAFSPTTAKGERATVQVAPVFDGADPMAALLQWQHEHHRQAQANVLFNSVDYRILPMPAPPVPAQERREALRWQLKDLVDFPVDDACIDCIDVPGPVAGVESRQVFTFATQPAKVLEWMKGYRQRRLALGAIDVPEMAMRNLSVQAAGEAAHAYVHLGLKSTRLVLVWQRELCAFRQFDVSGFTLEAADSEGRMALLERMALEIQRSTDAFSRQFHGADLRTVWVSAVRNAEQITDQLSQLLPQAVKAYHVQEHVGLDSDEPVVDAERGLDFTFAIGAALRRQEQ